MTKESLEPLVRKVLSERYKRRLPPNLFAQTLPPDRERLKEAFRGYYVETMGEWEEITDENKLAAIVAENLNECISEELLNPWPDDWD